MLTANDLMKQTRPKESGADDGANDYPPANASPYASKTEQDIQSLCREEVKVESDSFVRTITKVRNQISQIRSSLPTAIGHRANSLKTSLKGALLEHEAAVTNAADEVERRIKNLRRFKVLNELHYEPDYDASKVNLIGIAVLVVSLESAANAYFFG
jgi:hypothetical protein